MFGVDGGTRSDVMDRNRNLLVRTKTLINMAESSNTNQISVVSNSWNCNLNKTAALRPPTLSSTQNMSHYWEFLYLDLITFHLMYYLGDAISHIHLSVSLILCLCISLTLSFLYNTHTNTHTVLSASPQPLYKRSLFKGSMSGRIGPGSLPEAYQWRKSTLMLLL